MANLEAMLLDNYFPYPHEEQGTNYPPTHQGYYENYPMCAPPMYDQPPPPYSAVPNKFPNSKKRNRTAFTSKQLIALEEEFVTTKYLCRSRRIQMSQDLNLSEKQIKIWFQNRRMKLKKTGQKCESPQKSPTNNSRISSTCSPPSSAHSSPSTTYSPPSVICSPTFSTYTPPSSINESAGFVPSISTDFAKYGYENNNFGAYYNIGEPNYFNTEPNYGFLPTNEQQLGYQNIYSPVTPTPLDSPLDEDLENIIRYV